MNARALDGRSIVVTRPAHQAAGLAGAIRAAGGVALLYPAIAIEPVRNAKLDAAIGRLADARMAVFISRNSVDHGLPRVRELGARLPQVAAVGAATMQALESAGLPEVVAPKGPADSEALLAMPQLREVAGSRIVIFRGEGGREVLASTLRARGASVEYAECYRRVVPAIDATALLEAWARGAVDAVTVTSGQTLANFAWQIGEPGRKRLRSTPLFVSHERVRADAEAIGIGKVVVAGPSDDEMLEALVAYFGRAG